MRPTPNNFAQMAIFRPIWSHCWLTTFWMKEVTFDSERRSLWKGGRSRVARVFLAQTYQNGKNILKLSQLKLESTQKELTWISRWNLRHCVTASIGQTCLSKTLSLLTNLRQSKMEMHLRSKGQCHSLPLACATCDTRALKYFVEVRKVERQNVEIQIVANIGRKSR
jgi:hypothetical protein